MSYDGDDPTTEEFEELLKESSLGSDPAADGSPGEGPLDEGPLGQGSLGEQPTSAGPDDPSSPRVDDPSSPRVDDPSSPDPYPGASGPTTEAFLADNPQWADELFTGPYTEPFRYRLGREPWGRGGQGTVYRAIELGAVDYLYALKELRPEREDITELSRRWHEKLRRFRTLYPSPNFAVPLEVFVGPAPARPGGHDPSAPRIFVLMPWLEGQNLAAHLREYPGERHLVGNLELLIPVAETLDWLPGQGANLAGERFVHGDVKPENIIVVRGRGGVLVDPDLWGTETASTPQRWITRAYAAPEVVERGEYSGATDRFSLGKVVAAVLLGEDPDEGGDHRALRERLREVPVVRERPAVLDMLVPMLAENAGGRPQRAAPWLADLIGELRAQGLPDPRELHVKRRRRRLGLLALVLVVVLGVVSGLVVLLSPDRCDPADGDRVGRGDGVLKIGTLLPGSGDLAAQGPQMLAATRLALADVAAARGLPGIQIQEGDAADEGGSASAVCDAVGAMLRHGVDVIVGPAASETALGVIGRVGGADAMLVSPAATAPELSAVGGPRFFRTAPSDLLQGRILAGVVAAEGNRRVTVIARGDAYGLGLQNQVVREMQGLGVDDVATATYDPARRDFSPALDGLAATRPDGVVVIGFDETAPLLRQMIDRGLGPRTRRVYGTDGFLRETLPAQVVPGDPGAVAGLAGTTLLPGPAFEAQLRAFKGDLADLEYAAQAYDAVIVTALAAAAAGTDDPAAISARMVDVTRGGTKCTTFADCKRLLNVDRRADIDYDGPSGPLELTGSGEPCIATYSVVRFDAAGKLEVRGEGRGANLCVSLATPGR